MTKQNAMVIAIRAAAKKTQQTVFVKQVSAPGATPKFPNAWVIQCRAQDLNLIFDVGVDDTTGCPFLIRETKPPIRLDHG